MAGSIFYLPCIFFLQVFLDGVLIVCLVADDEDFLGG
jgi:hypothetical protein